MPDKDPEPIPADFLYGVVYEVEPADEEE